MIDQLIEGALQARRQAVAAFEAQQQAEQEARISQLTAEARGILYQLLGEAVVVGFQMEFMVFSLRRDDSGSFGAVFDDPETEYQWRLERSLTSNNGFGRSESWHLFRNENSGGRTPGRIIENAQEFLVAIGESREVYHAEQRKKEAEQAAAEAKRIETERIRKERDEAYRREQEQRKAKAEEEQNQHDLAKLEHERLMALVEVVRQRYLDLQWQWEAGKTITLYKVRWCCGISGGNSCGYEDDEASFDYEDGWSLTDELDERGYIQLVKSRYQAARHLKLNAPFHLPTFTQYIFTSETLPYEFTQDDHFVYTGIQWQRLGGENLLVENEDAQTEFDLRRAPMQWVQEAVR